MGALMVFCMFWYSGGSVELYYERLVNGTMLYIKKLECRVSILTKWIYVLRQVDIS